MSERNYYVLCEDNCKFPAMTKEQILTAIEQAVGGGGISDIDAGFVTTIKEMNRGTGLRFWVGTTAEYNALEEKPKDCFCILTDETTYDDVNAAVKELAAKVDELGSLIVGHPLAEGVEYRTGEMFYKERVYTMLIAGVVNDGFVTFSKTLGKGARIVRQSGQLVYNEGGAISSRVINDLDIAVLQSSGQLGGMCDASKYGTTVEANVQVWYTKGLQGG